MIIKPNNPLLDWIPRLAGQRVLVIGDVMLDEYLTGNATRMSREAPVPVLEFRERRLIAGGAANPSANIVALGSEAIQVGLVGADAAADQLKQVLTEGQIDTGSLITSEDRPTTVKTRILAQMGLRFPQQVARIDTLSREPVNGAVEDQIIDQVKHHLDSVQAVLLSDYHNGLLTPSLVGRVREQARMANVLLASDSQGFFDKYNGFDLVKCNADDAAAYLQRDLNTDIDFAEAAQRLYSHLKLTGAMVVTRGADGATLWDGEQAHHCPSPDVSDVYDTVGAGDTAIAVMTLAVAAGAAYVDAVTLANYASGIVVRHVGNYAPSPAELSRAVEDG